MKSETGSVKKFDFSSVKEIDSPPTIRKQPNMDTREEYYQKIKKNFGDMVPKINKLSRTKSGDLFSKNFFGEFERKQ